MVTLSADTQIPDNARSLSSSGSPDMGTPTSSYAGANEAISRVLTDSIKGLGKQGAGDKSIMESYSLRRKNAETQGQAERDLTTNKYSGLIEDSTGQTATTLNLENEARRGFATSTALMKQLSETGAKRVRELARDRDSLLLQSKWEEAGRLDGLIADEEEAITNSRKNWLDSFLQLTQATQSAAAEERAARSFEMPDAKRAKDFEYTMKTANAQALQSLQTLAPDASILSTDDYDTAVQKYRNSSTYKRNVSKSEKELAAIDANIAQAYASVRASNASAAKSEAETRSLSAPPDADSPSAPQNILTSLKELQGHPGKGAAVGKSSIFNFMPGTEAASFNDKLDSVKALVTLPNLGLLKGAMSDSDRKFIQSAGTSLATSNTEADFDATLNKLVSIYEKATAKAGGGLPTPDTSVTNDGTSLQVPAGNMFGSVLGN